MTILWDTSRAELEVVLLTDSGQCLVVTVAGACCCRVLNALAKGACVAQIGAGGDRIHVTKLAACIGIAGPRQVACHSTTHQRILYRPLYERKMFSKTDHNLIRAGLAHLTFARNPLDRTLFFMCAELFVKSATSTCQECRHVYRHMCRQVCTHKETLTAGPHTIKWTPLR